MDVTHKKGKPRVVQGRIFALKELQRRLAAMGVVRSDGYFSHVFAENTKNRIDPSLKMFRAMAQALGLSLDEMWELIQKVRKEDCPRLRI